MTFLYTLQRKGKLTTEKAMLGTHAIPRARPVQVNVP